MPRRGLGFAIGQNRGCGWHHRGSERATRQLDGGGGSHSVGSPFASQPSMLRRLSQVARLKSVVRTHVVSRLALTAWAMMMGLASLIAGAVALSVRLAPHASRRSTASTHAPDATRRARGTPVRLANLAPSVIFADASTLSYRTSLTDDAPDIQDVVRRATPGGRPTEPSIAVHTAIGACLTSDLDGSAHDHDLTVTWFFAADSGAPHGSGEYVLWEQRNDSTPVALVRHVLRDGRRPFLDYQYVVPSGDGADSIAIVPRTMLPISRADTVSTPVECPVVARRVVALPRGPRRERPSGAHGACPCAHLTASNRPPRSPRMPCISEAATDTRSTRRSAAGVHRLARTARSGIRRQGPGYQTTRPVTSDCDRPRVFCFPDP